MTQSPIHLFCCGPLKPGTIFHASHLAGLYDDSEEGSVIGRLMFLPDPQVPALLPGESRVMGRIFFGLKEEALPRLDYLFGARMDDPKKGEYVRRSVMARRENGSEVEVQAYFLRAEVLRERFPNAQEIPEGRFDPVPIPGLIEPVEGEFV